MGKRVVDDASLTAVADKLRSRSAAPDSAMVFPKDFLEQVDLVHEQGRTEGVAEGAAICAAKHFIHSFVGDGTGSVSFHVPFEPDAIKIMGFDPRCHTTKLAVFEFMGDLRAFGTMAGGVSFVTASGQLTTNRYTTASVFNRYSRSEDGVVTIGSLVSSADVVFFTGHTYTVIAVKYTELTDKERIVAFVNSLDGSGTVSLNQEKVNAAFTDDEWAALIATKPDWTFTWI